MKINEYLIELNPPEILVRPNLYNHENSLIFIELVGYSVGY